MAIRDSLPGHLWGPSGGKDGAPPRIAGYRGESALLTWLTTVALRLLQEGRRPAGPAPAPLADAATRVADPTSAPLAALVGAERAIRLERALREAWESLTPKECLAVLLRYRDGLPQKEIARLLRVGEPRVSRLLDSGVSRLREEVARRSSDSSAGAGEPGGGQAWQALVSVVATEMARRPGGTL